MIMEMFPNLLKTDHINIFTHNRLCDQVDFPCMLLQDKPEVPVVFLIRVQIQCQDY